MISIRRIIRHIERLFPIVLISFLLYLQTVGALQNLGIYNIFLWRVGDMHLLSIQFFTIFVVYSMAVKREGGFYFPIILYALHELFYFIIAYSYNFVSLDRLEVAIPSLLIIIAASYYMSSLDKITKVSFLYMALGIISITYGIWMLWGFSSSVGSTMQGYYRTEFYDNVITNMQEVFSWLLPITILAPLCRFVLIPKAGITA